MKKSMMLCKKLSMVFIFVFAMFLSGCEEVVIGTNLEKGDKYYAKGQYEKAYACYMQAASDYQAKMGSVYSSTDSAKADAMKMVEAYYKSGLTCEQLSKSAEARQNFENAMKDAVTVKQSYYEKVAVNIPDGYKDQWVPAEYKDVWVDGYYKDVWKDGEYKDVWVDATTKDVWVDATTKDVWVDATYKDVWVDATTKDVWVDGSYKEVWVDGSYEEVYNDSTGKYDKVWKDGYYKDEYVPGYYKKETVPGYYEKKLVDGYYKKVTVDGYYKKVTVDGHYEKKQMEGKYEKVFVDGYYEKKEVKAGYYAKVFVPAHVEYNDVYKEKDSTVNLDKTYYDLASQKVGAKASTASATTAVVDENDLELKAAQEEMKTAYQAYLKVGAKSEGAEFNAYVAAQEKYQKVLASKKK